MSCIKISYQNKKHAEKALRNIKKKGYLIADNTYSYLCPYCKCFHIGHDKFYKEKNKFEDLVTP